MSVAYCGHSPGGAPSGRTCRPPLIFGVRGALWDALLGRMIDDMSSDVRTLDVLGALVRFVEPRVVVEVGTYRGWGTMVLAETLHVHGIPGHVWSCDPTDYGVQSLADGSGLGDRVTLVRGIFEDVVPQLPGPIDLCYIDASDADEAGLRLRCTHLALKQLGPGGVICVDDTAGDWEGVETLRALGLSLPQARGLVVIAGV